MTRKKLERTLQEYVELAIENYLSHLGDQAPAHVYNMVMRETEKAVLKSLLKYAQQNRSKAAKFLGLNRGTLSKKLKEYELDNNDS